MRIITGPLCRSIIVGLLCIFGSTPFAFAAGVDVFVFSGVTGDVLRFDGTTGTPLGTFASAPGTEDMIFGPNGDLFIASGFTQSVLRFDGTTGALLGTFATVGGPKSLTFGPNGDLFVVSGVSQSILRFDGTTGAPLGTFATVGGPRSLTFGPNGDLFVTSGVTNSILRFDGTTGTPLGAFASAVDSCLGCIFSMSFGPGGDLFAAEGSYHFPESSSGVFRFNGTTGAPMGIFDSSPGTTDFVFGPNGEFFVSTVFTQSVLRNDEMTATSLGTFASVRGPFSLAIGPSAVPEPSELALTATGLLILLAFAHRLRCLTIS